MADPTPTPETTAVDHNPAMDKPKRDPSPTSPHPFSNPNPSGPPPPPVLAPPPPGIQPSFRPSGAPVPVPSTFTPQFSPVAYQTPGVPPPGVIPAPGVGSGPVTSHHPMMAPPYSVASQPVRYGPPMSNGYPGMPQSLPQGAMPPVSHD